MTKELLYESDMLHLLGSRRFHPAPSCCSVCSAHQLCARRCEDRPSARSTSLPASQRNPQIRPAICPLPNRHRIEGLGWILAAYRNSSDRISNSQYDNTPARPNVKRVLTSKSGIAEIGPGKPGRQRGHRCVAGGHCAALTYHHAPEWLPLHSFSSIFRRGGYFNFSTVPHATGRVGANIPSTIVRPCNTIARKCNG